MLHLALGLVHGSHGGGQLQPAAQQVEGPGRAAEDVGHQQEGHVHEHTVQVLKLGRAVIRSDKVTDRLGFRTARHQHKTL